MSYIFLAVVILLIVIAILSHIRAQSLKTQLYYSDNLDQVITETSRAPMFNKDGSVLPAKIIKKQNL